MRSCGTIGCATGLGPHDHVCWTYDDQADLRDSVVEFLTDGLARGLRVEYIAGGDVGRLREDVAAIGDLDGLIERGALRLTAQAAMYAHGDAVDPRAQVGVYAAATDQALADGYTGYRAAAEATELVRTPAQLEAFSRYEHLVDRYMAGRPFSAMCAYDRALVEPASLAALACIHPLAHGIRAPFQVFAEGQGLALRGEVDLAGAQLFAEALQHAIGPLEGAELVVDVHELTFIDVRGLATLDRQARAHGGVLVLRGARRVVGRAVDLLGLTALRVEVGS